MMADMPDPERTSISSTHYRKLNNKDPDQNAAWGYAGMLLLAAAINDAGPSADRAKVRDAIAELHDVLRLTGAGKFSYDQNRMPYYQAVMVQFAKARDWCK